MMMKGVFDMQNKDGLFMIAIFEGDDIESIGDYRAPASPRVGDFVSLNNAEPYRVHRVEWLIRDCEVDYVAVHVLPEKRG